MLAFDVNIVMPMLRCEHWRSTNSNLLGGGHYVWKLDWINLLRRPSSGKSSGNRTRVVHWWENRTSDLTEGGINRKDWWWLHNIVVWNSHGIFFSSQMIPNNYTTEALAYSLHIFCVSSLTSNFPRKGRLHQGGPRGMFITASLSTEQRCTPGS